MAIPFLKSAYILLFLLSEGSIGADAATTVAVTSAAGEHVTLENDGLDQASHDATIPRDKEPSHPSSSRRHKATPEYGNQNALLHRRVREGPARGGPGEDEKGFLQVDSNPADPPSSTGTRSGGAGIPSWLVPPGEKVINIDIGTAGSTDGMQKSDEILITFDPFDTHHVEPGYERLAYIIADVEGKANFTVLPHYPNCGTLHRVNPLTREAKRKSVEPGAKPCGKKHWNSFRQCVDTRDAYFREVNAIRLSSFLLARKIQQVGYLKIDAQGTDFAIVRDVMERSPGVRIEKFMVECQKYDEAGPMHQLYMVNNDCMKIEEYVHAKHPSTYAVKEISNNCEIAEYNLVFSRREAVRVRSHSEFADEAV